MLDRSLQPPVSPFTNVKLDFPQQTTLSNGVPLQVINQGDDPVNRVAVYVRGGILVEPKPMIAMMTGTVALEGSKSHTSAEIAQTLDFNGAWKAVQSYDDWTELSLWSLNYNYETNLRLLAQCILQPTFMPDDLDLLQRRYAGTYAASHRRVKYLAALELRRLYYGQTHPLAIDITPDDILSITSEELRSFYLRYYLTSHMRVILAGKITDRELAVTDDVLGHIDIPGRSLPYYDWSTFEAPASGTVKVVERPEAVQSAIAIALPAVPRRHPHYFKLRVLITVLGGYFGSRLMSNIREEKGYTYGISAVLAGREHCSYIGISTECMTQYTWAVVDEIKAEMSRLREQLVPADELDTVRKYMISDLVKTLDTPFSVASYVGSTITFGVYPSYYNDQVKAIEQVTAADLLEMARIYLREERMLIAVVGNMSGFGR